MTAVLEAAAGGRPTAIDFELDADHEAHEPPEARGVPRDQVNLLVSPGEAEPIHARFDDLPTFLDPGDLVVVNTSGTVAAAVDGELDGRPVVVHVSNEMPGGLWLLEVRQPGEPATSPLTLEDRGTVLLPGGARAELLARFGTSRRLWLATVDPGSAPSLPRATRRPTRSATTSRRPPPPWSTPPMRRAATWSRWAPPWSGPWRR
jgi:S-adenosylmethionine:tRNA ribosyltransferase-isomerase